MPYCLSESTCNFTFRQIFKEKVKKPGSVITPMRYSARVICLLAILLAITWLSDYPHALQRRVICSLAILLAMPNSNRK